MEECLRCYNVSTLHVKAIADHIWGSDARELVVGGGIQNAVVEEECCTRNA